MKKSEHNKDQLNSDKFVVVLLWALLHNLDFVLNFNTFLELHEGI